MFSKIFRKGEKSTTTDHGRATTYDVLNFVREHSNDDPDPQKSEGKDEQKGENNEKI